MGLSKEEIDARKQKKRQEKYDGTHNVIDKTIYKICSIHNEWLPMNDTYYYRNKSSVDGFNPYCIECTKEKTKKWQEDNSERYYEMITHRGKNPSPRRLKTLSERSLKQRLTGYNQKWRKENPEKSKKYNRKRSEEKDHEISDNELNVLYEYANYSCMYCGMTEEYSKYIFGERLHRDHAYNSGSNGIDNCLLACKSCNSTKNHRDWDVWYTPDNIVFDINSFNKIVDWLKIQ